MASIDDILNSHLAKISNVENLNEEESIDDIINSRLNNANDWYIVSFDEILSTHLQSESEGALLYPDEIQYENLINETSEEKVLWPQNEVQPEVCGDSHGSNLGHARKSAQEGKKFAFEMMAGLNAIYSPCNSFCYLNGYCTKHISGGAVRDIRLSYFGDEGISFLFFYFQDKRHKRYDSDLNMNAK
jgi:hypothetical protein